MGPVLRRLAEPLDRALDQITSYRLVLYFLLVLSGWSVVMAAFGELPYEWLQILLSVSVLAAVCWAAGYLFSIYLNIPRNKESDFISALILALILSPPSSFPDTAIIAAAGFLAVASKYLLVIGRRHIFNPAAAGAFSAAWLFGYLPSWWIGTATALPLVIAGGWLILRKMKRYIMVTAFLTVYFTVYTVSVISGSGDLWFSLKLSLTATSLLFFAYIMLTEPLTSPHSTNKIIAYALVVGLLYSVTGLRLAPEEALLLGNIFAYALTRDKRYALPFKGKRKEADGIYSYLFSRKGLSNFRAGQYMEWTLPSTDSDSRGNRRYLTVSSSPTEKQLMLTVKMPEKPSSFKRSLSRFAPGDRILVSRLSGEFTLPSDKSAKLVFLAGGVGITPFRSIIKYMLDTRERRDVQLLYSAENTGEMAFTDLIKSAKSVGVKAHFAVTGKIKPQARKDQAGPIDAKMIKKLISDYQDRRFYVSGPYGFVLMIRKELEKLGVPASQIRLDYFPGYG